MSAFTSAITEDDDGRKEANRIYYQSILQDRTVHHPHLDSRKSSTEPFCFVIGADTQLGMASVSSEWQTELNYCIKAINHINSMTQKPEFVCMCGDLVDMHPNLFNMSTPEDRIKIQMQQYADFQECWQSLNPDIPLLCLCGNHDVGNQPTLECIERFKSQFGDDYFAFWCKGCYFICLNTNIYFDSTLVPSQFTEQHAWFKERLEYARKSNARKLFVCGHHPWFLFNEDETEEDLTGINSFFARGVEQFVSDAYFPIKIEQRKLVLDLCQEFKVDACFSGHFHQNLVSYTSWGMPMIVTGAICNILLKSSAKDESNPLNVTTGPGVRVVTVDDTLNGGFSHNYEAF